MKVTPSTIASAVSASLSLWASRPLIVTFRMSGSQRPHPLQDRIRGRLLELAHHGPVGKEEEATGVRRPRGSCVTITIDWPNSVTDRRRNASTSAEALESRLPVGSSAKMRSGLLISARAHG